MARAPPASAHNDRHSCFLISHSFLNKFRLKKSSSQPISITALRVEVGARACVYSERVARDDAGVRIVCEVSTAHTVYGATKYLPLQGTVQSTSTGILVTLICFFVYGNTKVKSSSQVPLCPTVVAHKLAWTPPHTVHVHTVRPERPPTSPSTTDSVN